MSDTNGTNGTGPVRVWERGASSALARAARFEETALDVSEDLPEYHLDQEELCEWILRKSDPKRTKEQRCVTFQLFHDHKVKGLDAAAAGTPMPTGRNATAEERTEVAREIALEFFEESENRAATFSEVQRFQVSGYAVLGDTAEERGQDPVATRSFLVSPPQKLASSSHQGNSDGQTIDAVQIVGELQRQNGVMFKQAQQAFQSMQERLISWNTSAMGENRMLNELCFEQMRKMEALLDDRARRDAEATEKKMHIEAQWQLIQGGMTVGKAFIDRWMATKMPPPPPNADGTPGEAGPNPLTELGQHLEPAELAMIVAAMKPDNRKRFAAIAGPILAQMKPEDQMMVSALLERMDQERSAAEQAAKIKVTQQAAPPPASPSPEAAPTAASPSPTASPKSSPKVSKKDRR